MAADPLQWPLRALRHSWTVESLGHPAAPSLFIGAALTALAAALLFGRTLHRISAG